MDDVASDLITNIEGYQQLLTTLALGICAGAFALVTQIMMHNAGNPDKKVVLSGTRILMTGTVLEFLSICLGIATKSALVASVAALHAIQWDNTSVVPQLRATALYHLPWLAVGQVTLFALGILCFLVAFRSNLRLLK